MFVIHNVVVHNSWHLIADRQPSWYEKWASSWGGKERREKNSMYVRSVLRMLLWATYWNHRCFTEGGGSDKTKCWIAGKTSLSGREEQRPFENHVSTKSLLKKKIKKPHIFIYLCSHFMGFFMHLHPFLCSLRDLYILQKLCGLPAVIVLHSSTLSSMLLLLVVSLLVVFFSSVSL